MYQWQCHQIMREMNWLKLGFVTIFVVPQVICYEELLVDKLRLDFLTVEDELWRYVLSNKEDGNRDLHVMHRFNLFDKKMNSLTAEAKFLKDPLYGMEVIRKTDLFLHVFSDMKIIFNMYSKFIRYLNHNLSRDKNNLENENQLLTTSGIVEDILYSKESSVNITINNIFHKIFVTKPESVLHELYNLYTKNDSCTIKIQSAPQIFYNLYNMMSLIELKGYIMTQFAYLAQRLERKGNNSALAELTRKEYRERVKHTTETLRGLMTILKSVGGNIKRCEPKQHVEGVTYEKLFGILQGHVENEVDLNAGRSCTKTCADYSFTSNYGCYDSKSEYCRNMKPCNGKILGCKFIESHFKACISPSRTRRYDFVEYDTGVVYGKKKFCSSASVNSWHRWFVHCSYCFCFCDSIGSSSDRYFNLRPVLSDTKNNMVVTGLRVVKHNRIIHLQIQEGKLGPYGFIDSSTVRWVPPEDYKITNSSIKNGEDYHMMDYDSRTLLLNNLYAHETDHIVTGVRFEYIENHLTFQIQVRSFNFSTGLLANDSYYIYGSGYRAKVKIVSPDIPTLTYKSKEINDNGFVEFTHSDINKDAAQTTIPFFDSQPVAADPPVPLTGAGIYYKGEIGYGGFIAPKISTYDFSNHMNFKFPIAKTRDDNFEEIAVPMN